ncbi:AAC-rich mRNA clone AAC11 protein-like [Arachis ipaensis]|uniref:AAC-rich mRNA clone AAC11 protein-like n=1 Tax=Arachis ipaensis TaxID=130454 RepID=UPI0007AEFC7B|nr:AAC-rich mRNA clone AAC11 protein-like [Arachis ipaensis]XP_025670360.1 AAC-rich mRNA clone AAC11 protein-like [Arachis hypogaea]
MTDVQTFRQLEAKSLYQAWERYKALIRRCPSNMFGEWVKLHNFYEGLSMKSRKALDYSSGGPLQMMKTLEEAHDLIDMVANNQYFYSSERQATPKRDGNDGKKDSVLQLAVISTTRQVPNAWSQNEESFEAYNNEQQPEQVKYMHNTSSSHNDFHGDTYISSWRNHPNLSWGDNQNQWQRNSNPNNFRNTSNQNHHPTNNNPYRKPQNNVSTSTFYPQNNPANNPTNFHQQPTHPQP